MRNAIEPMNLSYASMRHYTDPANHNPNHPFFLNCIAIYMPQQKNKSWGMEKPATLPSTLKDLDKEI